MNIIGPKVEKKNASKLINSNFFDNVSRIIRARGMFFSNSDFRFILEVFIVNKNKHWNYDKYENE